jgi:hypothetical protein
MVDSVCQLVVVEDGGRCEGDDKLRDVVWDLKRRETLRFLDGKQ